ncbi:methyltransferase domain-containing protein [Pendulispora rubella]|uniref:Methyltransferase domain-containing protein n=1 Tax=Pendulispora rubella TaxID=2741070 RepID=A0ABZ2KVJ9_9BACT
MTGKFDTSSGTQWLTIPENVNPRVLATREGYDLWSEIYDSEQNPLILLEEPEVKFQLGNVHGLSVADVGCGTGRHAIRLAREGAKVTALDFSSGMMGRAKEKAVGCSVDFVMHDLRMPLPIPDRSMDRVISCLVIDHFHAAQLPTLFRELGRICRQDGFILISVMHPAMLLRGVQARFADPRTGVEIRPKASTNLVSDYVIAAQIANLPFLALSEHTMDVGIAAKAERAQKYIGWPVLLMMKLAPQGVSNI